MCHVEFNFNSWLSYPFVPLTMSLATRWENPGFSRDFSTLVWRAPLWAARLEVGMEKLKFILTSTLCALDCRPLSTRKFILLSSAPLFAGAARTYNFDKKVRVFAYIRHSTQHLVAAAGGAEFSPQSRMKGAKNILFFLYEQHLRVSDLIRSF